MFCRRCGSQIPEGLGMCSVCGLEIDVPWQPAPAVSPATAAPRSVVPPPASYALAGPVGVGGWLLFFCIGFTILWPLWQLSQYARFHLEFRGLGWLGLSRLGLGFVAGVLLWTKNPFAMALLRFYYALSALLSVWGVLNLVRAVKHFNAGPLFWEIFLRGFGSALLFLIAGVFYFALSRRVRATYGSNLFG